MKLEKNDSNLKKILELLNNKSNIKNNSEFMIRYNHSQGYGKIAKEKLTNYLMLTICNSRIFTKRTKVALIDDYSFFNSEKVFRELLQESIADLRKERIPYINVEPKDKQIFKNVGFVDSVFQKEYQFSYSNLSKINKPEKGNIKVGYWTDLIVQNGAAQLYEVPLHTSNERNTLNRPYWFWNLTQQVRPERKLAVYYGRVGLPVGYMFFTKNEDEVFVEEIFSQNTEGTLGLFSYLKDIGNKDMHYSLLAPELSKYQKIMSDGSEINISTKPCLMTRIIDFESVLSSMKVNNKEPAVIQVTDDILCPWNNGNWKIEFIQDQVVVSKTKKAADYSAKISEWTKVLLGNLTLTAAINQGKVTENKKLNLNFEKGTVSFFERF